MKALNPLNSKNLIRFFFLLSFLAGPVLAQQQFALIPEELRQSAGEFNAAEKSPVLQAARTAEIGLSSPEQKWAISLRTRTGRVHTSPEMAELKATKMAEKIASIATESPATSRKSLITSSIGTNFEANWSVASNPPDNTIAISNAGIIVSANNDGVEYYNQNGQFLYFEFWSDFINDPQLTSSIYDPVILYDSGADRFILAVLHGTQSSTSQVLLLFSKTNDPLDGWHLYRLTGNPLNNNTWLDYPHIGVSDQEVFITGNLYNDNDNFDQAVIYQIEKSQGLAGNNLNWQYWSNLSNQPFSAFSLVPTTYGHQGNIGPGMLFVSTRSGGDNRSRLWELTDYINNNPALNVYTVNVSPYSPAGEAFMPNTTLKLDNSDCRMLSAFYLDESVHYVMHSDVGQGWNGIHYNRLDLNTLTNQTATLGLSGTEDYSYPAMASFSTQVSDPTVMIAFLRSSQTTFPSASVVKCDANMQWSQPVEIKAGETHIDFLQGDTQRWGDYTGMARKHNSSTPEVWSATCYGADITTQNGNVPNTYKTWVTQIGGGSISLEEVTQATKLEIFPNPVVDLMNINFTLDSREEVSIEIIDMLNRPVKLLYRDIPKGRENRLSFNKGALAPGIYFVSIKTPTRNLVHEKIHIQN